MSVPGTIARGCARPASRVRVTGDDNIRDVSDGQAAPPRPELRTARLEAFSDGVFAIAITLLVLEISVPAGSEDDLLGAIADQWPSYLAYVVSFSTIGASWLAHAVITERLARADAILVRINLLLLMVVSFIPFPTRLLAEYSGQYHPARVAATVYGLTLFASWILLSLLWRYAVRDHLIRTEAAEEEIDALTARLTPSLAGYVLMIALGLLVPTAAVIGYLAIALFRLFPFGLRRRGPTASAAEPTGSA
jgi:uncharacterized membrane protein